MTVQEIVEICSGKLSPGFAVRYAPRVAASENGIKHLWLAYRQSTTLGLSPVPLGRLQMQSLYLLEKIYFRNPDLFRPYFQEFFAYIPSGKSFGTSRIYLKIAADLLCREPSLAAAEAGEELLSFCLELATKRKTPPATIIWAVEVLFAFKEKYPVLNEILPDLIEQMRQVPLPSIQCRVRQWLPRVSLPR